MGKMYNMLWTLIISSVKPYEWQEPFLEGCALHTYHLLTWQPSYPNGLHYIKAV